MARFLLSTVIVCRMNMSPALNWISWTFISVQVDVKASLALTERRISLSLSHSQWSPEYGTLLQANNAKQGGSDRRHSRRLPTSLIKGRLSQEALLMSHIEGSDIRKWAVMTSKWARNLSCVTYSPIVSHWLHEYYHSTSTHSVFIEISPLQIYISFHFMWRSHACGRYYSTNPHSSCSAYFTVTHSWSN